MNKYANGKIYKITSNQTDKIYIGSTIRKLSTRMNEHRDTLRVDQRYPGVNNQSSTIMLRFGDAKMELIELYPCNSRAELAGREQYWLEYHHDIIVNTQKARCTPTASQNDWVKCECGYECFQKYMICHRKTTLHCA